MPLALPVLDQRFDVVIVQPRFVTHGNRFDPKRKAARLIVDAHQRRSQKIVECVPERRSPGLAFAFNSSHHIVIEGNRSPDAHDASLYDQSQLRPVTRYSEAYFPRLQSLPPVRPASGIAP